MISRHLSPPMQLGLIFLMFGVVWILLTDFLLLNLSKDSPLLLFRFQTYKGVLFMIVSAIVIYFVSRRIFNRQKELQQALNDERLHHRNEMAKEVFNAQEAERKKIGEELHDNINQMLGVVKLYIEHAQVNPAAKDEMLRKSCEYLAQAINEIRSLSKALVSPTLQNLGLTASVYDLIETIQNTKAVEFEMLHDRFSEEELSDIQKLMLYRVIQEQLNNILKHSKAEHVIIELKTIDRRVYLRIEDDGIGFDPEQVKSGLGLKNIRHRLELLKGSLSISSSPGDGCRLEAAFVL